jgi:hypothetical protein
MKRFGIGLGTLLLCMLATQLLEAQATRTWVSGVGDDANPCSRTAPCKTFAGAISKTAAGGEIDALDPGGFGAITITKAITIDGGGGTVGGVLVSGTNGIVVVAGANDSVTLRNLTIDGIGTGLNGVRFTSGAALHVENCTIFGFTNHGLDLEPGAGGGLVFVVNTVIRDNAEDGIYAFGSSRPFVQVMVDRSNLDHNYAGAVAADNGRITVTNSEASGNQIGFLAMGNGGPAQMSLARTVAANNSVAGVQAGGGGAVSAIRIEEVSTFNNGTGFSEGANGTIASFGNNYNSGTGAPNATFAPQ